MILAQASNLAKEARDPSVPARRCGPAKTSGQFTNGTSLEQSAIRSSQTSSSVATLLPHVFVLGAMVCFGEVDGERGVYVPGPGVESSGWCRGDLNARSNEFSCVLQD